MSDAGNYCADCRFLHGAGVGYHAGGGGSAAPRIRAAAGGRVSQATPRLGGGGGWPGTREHIYTHVHTHRKVEHLPNRASWKIERCFLPGPCGNLESSVPQASHAIMLTGGIVYLATATLALFGFEKVAPTRELAAQIHREAGEFNPSG